MGSPLCKRLAFVVRAPECRYVPHDDGEVRSAVARHNPLLERIVEDGARNAVVNFVDQIRGHERKGGTSIEHSD